MTTTISLVSDLKRDFLLTDKQAKEEGVKIIVDMVNKGIIPIKSISDNKTYLNI
jgi:hypothetical protein